MSTAQKDNAESVVDKTAGLVSAEVPTNVDKAPEDTNVTDSVDASVEDVSNAGNSEIPPEDLPYTLMIKAPNGAEVPIIATAQETVQDIKHVVSETPATIEYSCFYLTHNGNRLNEASELGEIADLEKDSQLELFEDQYTEREARLHVSRLRDLLAGPVTANPEVAGLDAGAPIFGTIKYPDGVATDAIRLESETSSQTLKNTGDSTKQGGKKNGKKRGGQSAAEQQKKTEEEEETNTARDRAAATEHAFKDFEFNKVSEFAVLSTRDALKRLALPKCVQQVMLSGWNPVPRYRQLKGDLLYLLLTTLENQSYHVTCSRDGFYVNSSSMVRFNPEPYVQARGGNTNVRNTNTNAYTAHSLITLLKQLSPRFGQTFEELQRGMSRHEPVEILPFVSSEQAASPWLVRAAENMVPELYDPARPQDVYLRLGAQAADSLRDWNEELQSIREMPRTNFSERVLRDRQFYKWHSEFAEAAVRGAMAVVECEMVPLNPTDPTEQHMYLRDNIFYSKGFDGRETFTGLGGDAAAHVATGKDITGVRLLSQLDTEGLHTLGSVVVDYRGVRVIAQSVVPGIFRRQETTQIVYGSIDSGVTIGDDADFHKAMEPVAKQLHFGEHTVTDEAGNEHRLYTSIDVKGLTGTDGRKYVLDLYRMTPADVGFLESECMVDGDLPVYPHKLVLLRPELVEIFWENSIRKAVQEYAVEKAGKAQQENKAEDSESALENKEINNDGESKEGEDTKDSEKAEEAKDPKEADELKTNGHTENTDVTNNETSVPKNSAEDTTKEDTAKDAMADFDFSLEFSPDAFTSAQPQGEEDAMSTAVRNASKFLREVSVPAFARDLAAYTTSPLCGDALSVAMHQRGINMRYLGMIANLLPASTESIVSARRLVIFEMISRATKHILRDIFRVVPAHLHTETLALVLNALVGTRYCVDPAMHLSDEAKRIPVLANLTPKSLSDQISEQVELRFRFKLGDSIGLLVPGNERILMREVCLKVGAQLALQQYHYVRPEEAAVHAEVMSAMNFGAKLTKPMKRMVREKVDAVMARPLTVLADDVMNFVALTKVSTHHASFADEAFDAGRMALDQGQKDLGLELLLESLALHEQTFGFLHSESARCYAVVSLAHYEAGEYAVAADFMTKAVIISERTVGLDNPLTIHNYLNLSLYEHARGNTLLALRLIRHAVDLWSLVNSPDHPDLATAHNNIGVMLQSLNLYEDALRFFKSCVEIRVRLLGEKHVLVANAQHSLAKALALTGEFKEAVQVERQAHRFFKDSFGDQDPRTQETGDWLSELTLNAVRTAKLTKAAQEKLRNFANTANLMRVDQHGKDTAESSTTAGATGSKGELPIDQLLEFITGSSKPKPKGGRRSKNVAGSRR
ncbi:Intracellular distribution of mitochondria [Coemansia sp. RSA 1365]|nr:Intracellular distribution of mitochondria [Coemansia sp. RSA 1365]